MSQELVSEKPNFLKIFLAILYPIATLAIIILSFFLMRDYNLPKVVLVILALTIGIGGIWALFASMNNLASTTPRSIRDRVYAYVFVGPAVIILSIYLVYPAIRTIILSMLNRSGEEFNWFQNYIVMFTDEKMITSMINTLIWVIIVPFVSVGIGLLFAVLVDKLKPGSEKVAKAFIFLPMAISFVGAAVIWRFIYYFQPAGYDQVGLFNALLDFFSGGTAEPEAWLLNKPENNLYLIIILIWLQTGFAMTVLSSAIKAVPNELREAARIDGANAFTVFFQIVLPYIRSSIYTVLTTILFLVLKTFDIVWVMTSGDHDTSIIASQMYEESFVFRNFGRGSALAVFLFIVVIPFMVRNIQAMNKARSER